MSGAIVLGIAFAAEGTDVGQAAWWGIFHSVSGFNNAGFDLTGGFQSLSGYVGNPWILGAIGVLIVLGGLGYAIVGDAVSKRRWKRLALETKLVLGTTIVLIVVGALSIGAFEWSNPATLGGLPEAQRPLNALFESSPSGRQASARSIPQRSARRPCSSSWP